MTTLSDLIPSPEARDFLRIIDQERGRDVALWFTRALVAGEWVYAGESQLALEIARRAATQPADSGKRHQQAKVQRELQEAML